MRFELSDTQQLLQKSARGFLSHEAPIAEVRRIMETDTAHDQALWNKMADQGWMGLLIGEDYRGMGLGMVEAAALFEQMGRVLLPGPFHSTVAFAAGLIAAAGSEEQKQRYLASVAEGRMILTAAVAPAITEASGKLTGKVLVRARRRCRRCARVGDAAGRVRCRHRKGRGPVDCAAQSLRSDPQVIRSDAGGIAGRTA